MKKFQVTDIKLPEVVPLISIIVPIFKMEIYLHECIDSILKQTYQNLEIILIDDGSPDRCPAICDEYAEIDPRIIVVHQKNAGISCARNAGLDIARGEYIGFVDADDYISEVMYECLYYESLRSDADIVTCNCYWKALNLPTKKSYSAMKFSAQESILARLSFPKSYINILENVWNKLYKKEVIDGIRFDKTVTFGEDGIFNAEVIVRANRGLAYIDAILYANRAHRNSLRRSGKYSLDTRGIIEPFLTVYPEYTDMIEQFYELWSIAGMLHRNWTNIINGYKPNYKITFSQIKKLLYSLVSKSRLPSLHCK